MLSEFHGFWSLKPGRSVVKEAVCAVGPPSAAFKAKVQVQVRPAPCRPAARARPSTTLEPTRQLWGDGAHGRGYQHRRRHCYHHRCVHPEAEKWLRAKSEARADHAIRLHLCGTACVLGMAACCVCAASGRVLGVAPCRMYRLLSYSCM